MNNKILYENIMKRVAIEVKKTLYESNHNLEIDDELDSNNIFKKSINLNTNAKECVEQSLNNMDFSKTIIQLALKFGIKLKANDNNIVDIVYHTIEQSGVNVNLNWIDTSNVTNMSYLFYKSRFNGDISGWDVSNVTDMGRMFYDSVFNGDISNWDVSNVKNMYEMFYHSKFNRDISNWDASNVYRFDAMFFECPISEECKPKFKRKHE